MHPCRDHHMVEHLKFKSETPLFSWETRRRVVFSATWSYRSCVGTACPVGTSTQTPGPSATTGAAQPKNLARAVVIANPLGHHRRLGLWHTLFTDERLHNPYLHHRRRVGLWHTLFTDEQLNHCHHRRQVGLWHALLANEWLHDSYLHQCCSPMMLALDIASSLFEESLPMGVW
jgi:hypothetical protein